MRLKWTVVRWCAGIAVVALGVNYFWVPREGAKSAHYQRVLLLQSSSAFGLPLAGIAVDPQRREVYGLLGRAGKEVPPNFFILWKDREGANYAATFSRENDMTGLCQILPGGETRTVQDFRAAHGSATPMRDPSEALRSILNALPPESTFAGRP